MALAPQNRQVIVEVVCFPGEPKGEFWLLAHTKDEKRRLQGLTGFLKKFGKISNYVDSPVVNDGGNGK
jgi:hypothetical protein